MTTITHRFDMQCVCTERITGAEMRYREDDHTVCILCQCMIAFDTATGAGMGPVESALSHTFALLLRSLNTNHLTKDFPVDGIARLGTRHDVFLTWPADHRHPAQWG